MTNKAHDVFNGRQCDVWLVLDSSGFGGIESHVAALADALAKSGFKAPVILLEDHGGEHPLFERLAQSCVPWIFAGGAYDFIKLLRTHPPRVVHSHGYKANIVSRLAARLCGVRSVSTFHAGEQGAGRTRLYTALDETSSFLSKRIAVSRDIALRVPYDCSVIDNFVPLPHDGADTRRAGVGFVGRLSSEKGIDRFCRAAEIVKEMSDTPFHVFGDGPMRAELQARYPSIDFHGAVSNLGDWYRSLRLLVMPSRAEGLPMAALESMSSGLPVVASRVGGLPELIVDGHNGWLTENTDDADGLADAIRLVLDLSDQDIAAIGLAARHTIATRYSPEAAIPKILGIYGLEKRLDAYDDLAAEARRA